MKIIEISPTSFMVPKPGMWAMHNGSTVEIGCNKDKHIIDCVDSMVAAHVYDALKEFLPRSEMVFRYDTEVAMRISAFNEAFTHGSMLDIYFKSDPYRSKDYEGMQDMVEKLDIWQYVRDDEDLTLTNLGMMVLNYWKKSQRQPQIAGE